MANLHLNFFHIADVSYYPVFFLFLFSGAIDSSCCDAYNGLRSSSSSSSRRYRRADPVILTKSDTLRVPEGQSLTLACDVQNLGE